MNRTERQTVRKALKMGTGGLKKYIKILLKDRIVPVRQYRPLRTALAVILYAVSPFWFYLLGETPGGSGKGVFLMFFIHRHSDGFAPLKE